MNSSPALSPTKSLCGECRSMIHVQGKQPSSNFRSLRKSSPASTTSPSSRRDSRLPAMKAAHRSRWFGYCPSTFLSASQAPYIARKFWSLIHSTSFIGSLLKPVSQNQLPSRYVGFLSSKRLSKPLRPGNGSLLRSTAQGHLGKGAGRVDCTNAIESASVSLHSHWI